jgi:hypothetical protein
MEKIMTKTTCQTEVTEGSLKELESVSGGVELVHEGTHAEAGPTRPSNHNVLLARFGLAPL